MKPGQKVIFRSSYRAYGKPGGWTWREYDAIIVTRKKRSAVIKYTNFLGHVMCRRVHIDRIRPNRENVKVSMKVENIHIEISGG